MIFEIVPTRSAGPLRFGMTKAQVRAVLGDPDTEFVRAPEFAKPGEVEWIYDALWAFVNFSSEGRCELVTIGPPSDVIIDGASLVNSGGAAAWETIRRLDPEAFLDQGHLTSKRLWISLYAPDIEEDPDEQPQYVAVAREGYWDHI